jgi:hypothetical protein
MTTRRGAFRLNLGRPGILYFDDDEVKCIVVDISATGARVRLTPPTLVPDEFSLETTVADHTVEMDARLMRSDDNAEVAMVFANPEYRYLHKLLHEEQRRIIASGVRTTSDQPSGPWDEDDSGPPAAPAPDEPAEVAEAGEPSEAAVAAVTATAPTVASEAV